MCLLICAKLSHFTLIWDFLCSFLLSWLHELALFSILHLEMWVRKKRGSGMVAWFYCKIFSVFNSGRQNGELRFKKGGGGGKWGDKGKGRGGHQWYGEGWWCCFAGVCSTVQGGPLSLLAPLNPSHLPRPWNPTHSSVSPTRRRVRAQPCHACVPTVPVILLSLFSPSFSLSEWVSGLSAVPPGKMDRHCFTADMFSCKLHIQPCSHMSLSLTPERRFSFPLPTLLNCGSFSYRQDFLAVNVRDTLATFFSYDRLLVCCQNSWISYTESWNHFCRLIPVRVLIWQEVHIQPAVHDFSKWESATSLDQSCWSPRCVVHMLPVSFSRSSRPLLMESDLIMNRLH